jgi:2-polyprenyl-3-methyl-5-hydroxy-6-metoxy-1,4-benzoquinol methylase
MTSKALLSPRFQFNPDHPFQPSVSPFQRELIREVAEKLKSNQYHLQPTTCPCGANKNTDITLSEIDRYGFNLQSVLCMNCGTVRFDPYLDEDSLSDFYSRIYRKMYGMVTIEEKGYEEYFHSQVSYAQQILASAQLSLNAASWVCEIGCSVGGALHYFQEKGFNVVGCDYDINALEFARQKGLKHLYYGGVEALAQHPEPIQFDLIYLHHVFEHLSDPVAFLQECKKYLSPHGKVVVIVPNVHEIDKIGDLPAVGNLLMYLHIAHKYNFSLEGMRQLCNKAGYSVDRLKLNPKIITRGSGSPELWVQMNQLDSSLTPVDPKVGAKSPTDAGLDVLGYFQKTEKLYSLGLCVGQVRYKMQMLKSPKLMMARIQQKLGLAGK